MHSRAGLETEEWRDIRHSILKVRIKILHNQAADSLLRLHHIQPFPKAIFCRRMGLCTVSGDGDQKMERRTSFHLKSRKKIEGHMTSYLSVLIA